MDEAEKKKKKTEVEVNQEKMEYMIMLTMKR